MTTVMARISIPARLMDEMMLKTAGAFDVPNNAEGIAFMQWWEKSAAADRDSLMKYAYKNNVTLLEARNREIDG